MTSFIVTLDIDWAPEAAIEETLEFLLSRKILPTVFTTHNSKVIEKSLNIIEVGLHPFFGENSSHGKTISEVVKYVTALPHNLKAFRCHRFGTCNYSKEEMYKAGMRLSSNICTDLEIVKPFHDRFGLVEVPIFLEDGGYLWRKHPLNIFPKLNCMLNKNDTKVILIHPMHFVINSPNFEYMFNIKKLLSPKEWIGMSSSMINKLRWEKRGIRDMIINLLDLSTEYKTLGSLLN